MVQEVRPLGVLLSIHPRWMPKLLTGAKTVELRRRPPAAEGLSVLLYATAPVSAVVARAVAGKLHRGTPEQLWASVGDRGALSRAQLLAYLAGAANPGGLELGELRGFDPIPLPWRAPQSWMWLRRDDVGHRRLVACALAGAESRPS